MSNRTYVLLKRMKDRYIMQKEFEIIGEKELMYYLKCLKDVEEALDGEDDEEEGEYYG